VIGPKAAPEVLAVAAGVTLVLMAKPARAGEPSAQRTVGNIDIAPGALIGSQARSLGSAITIGAQKSVIVGRILMQ